jgi:PAS domain S-box-containing protein
MIARVRGRLLLIFAPILVLLAAGALLAIAGFAIERDRVAFLASAVSSVVAAGLVAMLLLYRQVRVRQRTQRGLVNVEARVAGMVESAMDPIVTIDEMQRIVSFNAAAEKAFGWREQALLGQPLDVLLPHRFRSTHAEHIRRFAQSGSTARRMGAESVLHALRAAGDEFPIEASISQHVEEGRAYFTVILRDVSERMRALSLLAQSEARLRGILDSAMDAIVTVDDEQRIVMFNAAAEKMFGCARSEAVGTLLGSFIPERFRDAHRNHLAQFGVTGVSSRRMGGPSRTVFGLARDGREFPIDASISQLSDSHERFFTVILRDISERVRTENALRERQEELQVLAGAAQIAREQEKSRIARELHDELAQSLTMLQMDLAWCKEKIPATSDGLGTRLSRMETLLRSTVAASRRIASDLRPLILDDLGLRDAVEWLAQDFTKRTQIPCRLSISDELDLAQMQSTAVFRIVQESLANVAKHAQASEVAVAIRRDDAGVFVRVRDDGRGFSLDDPRKPASLGLLGLRERAALLGGIARVASAPGAGTTVEVELPLGGEGFSP